ncbi:MAG: PaaI family thioesterase [Bacteroidales bacterium]|nr:PaaI family thioesterase [Bacteroidales bacterium]
MNKYLKFFEGDQFAAFCGIHLIECEPGYAKSKVDINPKHLNGAGVVHGGLLYTLADFTFAAAVNAYGFVTLSVSTNMLYFDKSTEGLIFAEAREMSHSNKLIHCDINIKHESGALLANFKGTAYITKKEIVF